MDASKLVSIVSRSHMLTIKQCNNILQKNGETYTDEKQEKVISKYKIKNRVHEEGYRNKPLIEEQKTNNTEKSETKARVEHVFIYFEYWLHLNKTQTSLFLFSVCTIFEVYRANHE